MSEEKEVTAGAQDTTLSKDELISITDWRTTIPEDIRDNKVIQETPDITTMAKRLIDSNDFISKSVRLPDDGDTSGMDELYNKLGRPESVEGYKVTRPEMQAGQKYDEGLEKSFLEVAHKIGLNSSQVNGMMEWNSGKANEQYKSKHDASVKAQSDLKGDWGNAFDERVAVVDEVLNQYGTDAAESEIKDNPGLIRLIYDIGKNLVEGKALGDGKISHVRSPQEAQGEIDKLKRDPNFSKAYYDKKDPTHNAAVEQMRLLMVEAHPEPEAVVL